MKYKVLSMVLLFVLLISFSAYAISFNPEETYDSVVVVYTEIGVGSGFSVAENLIATNAHVVGNEKNVKVKLYDGTTINGEVIKADYDKDLALIRVNKSLVPLSVNEGDVSIGQEVYAIGAPKDMPYTMTKGIISALDRQLGQNTYIQIDASVNSGNSGGPLVDDVGNVIGIITMKASNAEGIGFAIKVSEILAFAKDAENADDTNEVENSEEKTEEEKNADLIQLTKENETLKMIVIILSVLLVLSLLMNIKIRAGKKKKDEFDFEIEIEE